MSRPSLSLSKPPMTRFIDEDEDEDLSRCSRVLSDFKVTKLLGSGGFGAVFQAQNNLDQREYNALKISIAQGGFGFDELKEVKNLAKIPSHRNIVTYITAWVDTFEKYEIDKLPLNSAMKTKLKDESGFSGIVIQMELCGQDLRKWLSKHQIINQGLGRVIGIFEQIIIAVEHLHIHKLIHRDVKPENIFFAYNDPDTVKVGDLGIATDHLKGTTAESHTRGFGTRLYIAPEQESSSKYGRHVDLFSLGLVLFELFWPEMQPKNNNWDSLSQNFRDLRYQQSLPDSLQTNWPDIASLIMDMTKYDPKARPKFESIYSVIDEFKSKLKPSDYSTDSIGNPNEPPIKPPRRSIPFNINTRTVKQNEKELLERLLVNLTRVWNHPLEKCIREIKESKALNTRKVENLIRALDRRFYIKSSQPYLNESQPIGSNAYIFPPYMNAHILEFCASNIKEGACCLDIGSGSGFITAALSFLAGGGGRVHGIDHISELVEQSKRNMINNGLKELLDLNMVQFHVGDGRKGLDSHGPYDLIHIGSAVDEIDQVILDQLKTGGTLICVVGKAGETQKMQMIKKWPLGIITRKYLMSVIFTSLTDKNEQLNGQF